MRLLAHICDCGCVLVCKAIQSCIWLEPPGRNGRQCNPGGNCLVTRCLLANIPRKQAHVHGLHCTEAVAEVAANTLPIIASLLPSTSHRSASWLIIYLQLTFYKPRTSPSHTHTHTQTHFHTHTYTPTHIQCDWDPRLPFDFTNICSQLLHFHFSTFSAGVYGNFQGFQNFNFQIYFISICYYIVESDKRLLSQKIRFTPTYKNNWKIWIVDVKGV